MGSRIPKLHKMGICERRKAVAAGRGIGEKELNAALDEDEMPPETLDGMSENVIGAWRLPYCIAPNFLINQKEYLVPMVCYEAGIVAAASKAAKLIREHGGFKAFAEAPIMAAQIVFCKIGDMRKAVSAIKARKEALIALGNACVPGLARRGGGVLDFDFREYPAIACLSVEARIDVRDAMGANIANKLAEALALEMEKIVQAKALLKIVTNYASDRKAKASFYLPAKALARKNYAGEELAKRIVIAAKFAVADAKRACTQNKGAFNGMDAVAMALGNDCQALEAGGHCHASVSGYKPLCSFAMRGGMLCGEIELPAAVGIVGGISEIHPGVKLSLRILRVESARELAMVIASAGLASTLAALLALVSEGICASQIKLHERKFKF